MNAGINSKSDRLVVGFTASNVVGSTALLGDLLSLPSLKGMIAGLVVCDNSDDPESIKTSLEAFRQRGVDVRFVSAEETRKAARDGGFGTYYREEARQKGIAFFRTALHHYLYNECVTLTSPVAWILDDDVRVEDAFVSRTIHEGVPYALRDLLRKLREEGTDIAIGRIAGDPPIPGASMVRTQLLDFDFNLRALRNRSLSIDVAESSREAVEKMLKYPDFYYDLSALHNGHLETPWWYVSRNGSTDRLEILDEMLQRVLSIERGVNVFRQVPAHLQSEQTANTQSTPPRGGNTFVFNIECLRDFPNLSPHVGGVPFRRGDTVWVILNRRVASRAGTRKIVTTNLAVRQDRSSCKNSIFDPKTLRADILGSAFTRALDETLAQRTHQPRNCQTPLTGLRLEDHEKSFLKGRFTMHARKRLMTLMWNSWRIQGLVKSIRFQLAQTIQEGGAESAVLSKHAHNIGQLLESVERTFSPESIGKMREEMLALDWDELEVFLSDLDNSCRSYRDELSPPSNERSESEIQSFVKTRFGTRALKALAKGKEGCLVTDGKFVYKYFFRGVDNFGPGQMAFLRERLAPSRLNGVRHLIPLEQVSTDGNAVVFVTRLVPGHHYSGGHLNDFLDLIRECKNAGIVLTNIRPENILVTDDSLAYVDLGHSVEPFTQDGYREMCKRAYLVFKWYFRSDLELLLRRALNDDSLPELFGYGEFLGALDGDKDQEPLEDLLLPEIFRNSPRRVFDYGCGDGRIADKLSEMGIAVTAYDIDRSRYMAREHPGKNTFVSEEEMRSLLGSGVTFDVVLCNLVVCTIDDPKTVASLLADLRGLVGLDGRVVLGMCNPFNLESRESQTHVKRIDGETRGYADHFLYHKTMKTTHRTRTEAHRPLSWYISTIRKSGLEVEEMVEVPGTDLPRLSPGSDHIILRLKPTPVPRSLSVSLLIKASAMEWRTIRRQVRHIVGQLEGPRLFLERVVVVDSYEGPFIRQYDTPDLEGLTKELCFLVDEGTIDRVVVLPEDNESISSLNRKWFALDTRSKRSDNGQPTLTTLYGLDRCKGEYILHVDSDCLIGRLDRRHDFMAEAVELFERDPWAVTLSLPVAGKSPTQHTTRNENGKWRSEVRCGILSKSRLEKLMPLPNSISRRGALALPWHRSLDLKLKESHFQSYRGGDPRTFFIHVPNERKKDFNTWYNIMKAVEEGRIIEEQCGRVDLVGGTEDWLQKRSEGCVLVVRGRNVPISKVRRCLDSLSRQTDQDWGLLMIDAGSDNGMEEYIDLIARRVYGSRMTFVRNLVPEPPIANIYFGVRRLCNNADSVILMPDADDSFISDDAISHVKQAYRNGADMGVGGALRTDKEVCYQADFHRPRKNRGGNVWQPLRTFRKHLFDRIRLEDLEVDGEWVPHTEDWALMLPMAEMARSPVQFGRTIYLYDPSPLKQALAKDERESLISRIVGKPSYAGS